MSSAIAKEPDERVIVEARGGEIIVRRPRDVLEFESPLARDGALPWPRPDVRRARIAQLGCAPRAALPFAQ